MSKEFNKYLSEKLISYFSDTQINAGKKYYAKFDNAIMLNDFYNELETYAKNNEVYSEFVYDLYERYTACIVNINNVKILVAKEDRNVTLDFLTRLRNVVGNKVDGRDYSSFALLLLVTSNLDSISDGTESLHREGLPFHYKSIISDIEENMKDESNNLSVTDKAIIGTELNSRENDRYSDKASLELYKPILQMINSGCIKKEQYKDFSMFYDSELPNIKNESELNKRINNNRSAYEKIGGAIRTKNVETVLFGKFENGLITKFERLEKTELDHNWSDEFDFKKIKKSIELKKTKENLAIDKISIEYMQNIFCSENDEFFRYKHYTKSVKNKKESWVIFNDNYCDEMSIVIEIKGKAVVSNISDIKPFITSDGRKFKLRYTNIKSVEYSKIEIYDSGTNSKIQINLVVLSANKNMFSSVLAKIQNVDAKKKLIRLHCVEDSIKFNSIKNDITTCDLELESKYSCNDNSCLELLLSNSVKENDKIVFYLSMMGSDIKFLIEQNLEKSTIVSGIRLFKEKLLKNPMVYSENKIVFDNIEYRIDEKLKSVLAYEKQIIDNDYFYGKIINNNINEIELNLPELIKTKYLKIINYYKENSSTPSLCTNTTIVLKLYEELIVEINSIVDAIEEGKPITDSSVKNIFMLGAFEDESENKIYLSPLHPVNLAHQLAIAKHVIKDNIDMEVVKKFNSRFAYPYFYTSPDKLFRIIDNDESSIEWKSYVLRNDVSQNSSRYFVSRLLIEKIDSFSKHFNCMFSALNNRAFKINLINTGNCTELFEGLIKYYLREFGQEHDTACNRITVTIYNEKIIKTDFDILSNEILLRKYLLDRINIKNYNLNELVSYIKVHLSYYVRKASEEKFEYAHLSFYEMSSQATEGSNNMQLVESGVSLSGTISGITSTYVGNSYRTSFGSKDIGECLTNDLYKNMNSLALFSRKSDPYLRSSCISTEIKKEKTDLLDKIYESSHWVTFIDPKVDLSFFINSLNGENLTIIHYSDQYTTTSGYDAITVTNKTTQYKNLIVEYLKKSNIDLNDEEANRIINMFNAINGNWLLKLMSANESYSKEKISLISAVKLALAKFNSKDIIWVPMAIEEILRASGAVGLKQKEGLLSAKNLGVEKGQKSDDLLIIGIDASDTTKLKVYLHPIEVKIGEESYICSSKAKAKEQINATKNNWLNKNFGEDVEPSATKSLIRNYLMQLMLISVQKLKLYNVWESHNEKWDVLLEGELRRKLLNEDYVISNDLDSHSGIGTIMQFASVEDDNLIVQCREDEYNIIQSTEKYALSILTKDIDLIVAENNFEEIASLDEAVAQSNDIVACENVELVESFETEMINQDMTEAECFTITDENANLEVIDSKQMEVIFGAKIKNKTQLVWYPNDSDKIMHTNTGIIGTMGTGKTQFTKSIVKQLYDESQNNVDGEKIGILIFDYKGDYNKSKTDFIAATNAKVYDLCHLPFNPLSVIYNETSKPMLPLHIANTFKETLAKAYGLGVKQETLLRDVIMESYTKKGINKLDKTTWSKTPPTFKDVFNLYSSREGLKEDSLYAVMTALNDFEIFEADAKKTKSLYELIDGVTVIDLSGYDTQIQNLVVAITLDLLYSQMQANGHSKIQGNLRQLRKVVLVDEADNFLSQGFNSIKKIMKEGREFGVGTILSTQLLRHFSNDNDDFADYIFTWVVHNVSDLSLKDVRKIFNTTTKNEEDKLFRDIKNLQKHSSIVKFNNGTMPEYIEDLPFYKIISKN